MISDSVAYYVLEIVDEQSEQAGREGALGRLRADLPVYLEEVEENLSDLLPEGFVARIRPHVPTDPNEPKP
jgi:hypothetical protein